jgi:hypothetical protein
MTDVATESTPTESTVTESTPQSNEPSWWIDDNTPGQGERPAWLPPKYKKVSDLGNGYMEAEKRLGAFTGAPEEYNLGDLEIDESQLIVQEIKAVGKELNMSEEGLKKFLGRLSTAVETETEAHLEDQIKQLGKDGERLLTQYKNLTQDYFAPEEAEIIKGWVRTADDLKMITKLMATTNRSAVPTSQSVALANNHESVADLRAELTSNIQKFENDRNYQKNWSKRMEQAVARENR